MSMSQVETTSSVQAELSVQPGGIPLRPTRMQRIEAFISRLSTRNNFWHRVCSLIWLPFAWRSGIQMRRESHSRFAAILPFKRVNRNWYNAMAGAALLGNSEVAGGMFLFSECGSGYTVVCKQMHYEFLRPCLGPAVYTIRDGAEAIKQIEDLKTGEEEFNVDLGLDVHQILKKRGRNLRVGRCMMTFHCTPKQQSDEKARRRLLRSRNRD
jgi:hypothetical protein